jgi:hypothetical protein
MNSLIKIYIFLQIFSRRFMVLDADDREWVQLTTKILVFKVIKGVLLEHVNSCPHGQKQYGFKQLLIGIGIGAGIFGGGSGLGFLLGNIAGGL